MAPRATRRRMSCNLRASSRTLALCSASSACCLPASRAIRVCPCSTCWPDRTAMLTMRPVTSGLTTTERLAASLLTSLMEGSARLCLTVSGPDVELSWLGLAGGDVPPQVPGPPAASNSRRGKSHSHARFHHKIHAVKERKGKSFIKDGTMLPLTMPRLCINVTKRNSLARRSSKPSSRDDDEGSALH